MSYDYQQHPASSQPQHAPYGAYPQRQPGYAPPRQAGDGAFPTHAVTKERKRTSHGLHLVLTICTGGFWGLCVWLPLTAWHKLGPRKKTVTRFR